MIIELIWIWGVFGTLVVLFIVDYLISIPFLSEILGDSYVDEAYWLIPIYYFVTLYKSYRAYGSGFPLISTFVQFIGQMAVFFLFLIFGSIFLFFGTTDYQENKLWLEDEAPSIFTEDTKLAYPTDAELIYVSAERIGLNGSTNIVFRVDDIDAFSQKALDKYEFSQMVMNIPDIGNSTLGEVGNIWLPPFCIGDKTRDERSPLFGVFKKNIEVTDPIDLCGKRDVWFTQIDRWLELGIIMVILPKERLVWLNHTEWF